MSIENQPDQNDAFIIDLSKTGTPFEAIQRVDNKDDETGDQVDDSVQNDDKDNDQQTDTDDSTDDQTNDNQTDSKDSGGDDEGDKKEKDQGGEDDDDINPFHFVGTVLKERGVFSEDTEIPEDIDHNKLVDMYSSTLRDSIVPEIEKRTEQQKLQELYNKGYTEEDVFYARAKREGVDEALLDRTIMHERYAFLPEDVKDEQKVESIRAMYMARQFDNSEIKKMINSAEEDGEIDSLYNQSKTYHKNQYTSFVQKEKQRQKEADEAFQRQRREMESKIRNILSSREVLGEKFSAEQARELEDDIFKFTKTIDRDGTSVPITEVNAFVNQFNSDVELILYLFKKWKYRDVDAHQQQLQAQQKVESDFVKNYESKITKNIKASRNKKVKDKLKKATQQSQEGMLLDFTR